MSMHMSRRMSIHMFRCMFVHMSIRMSAHMSKHNPYIIRSEIIPPHLSAAYSELAKERCHPSSMRWSNTPVIGELACLIAT